jgi:hypothetical protein
MPLPASHRNDRQCSEMKDLEVFAIVKLFRSRAG